MATSLVHSDNGNHDSRGCAPTHSRARLPDTAGPAGALLFFLSIGTGNALNYLFNVLMSRALGPAEYGLLTSLLALTVVLAVPATILQTVTARYVAAFTARGQHGQAGALLLRMLINAGLLGVALAAALAAASGPVVWLLHLDGRTPVLVATSVVVGGMLLPVGNGALQGLQRFGLWGANAIGSAGVRVAAAMLLVWLGFGVSGAVLASGLAGAVGFVIAALPAAFILLPGRDRRLDAPRDLFAYAGAALAGTLAFAVLTNVDVIAVRHFFTAGQAGQYAAAAVLGKVALFFPGAVGMLMFPKVAAAQARGHDTSRLLARSLAVTLLLGLVGWLPMLLWPGLLVGLLFGPGYGPAGGLVPLYGLAMVLLGVLSLLLQFYLSTHNRRFVALLCADALALTALLVAYHPTLTAVILVLALNGALLLPVSELLCRGLRRTSAFGTGRSCGRGPRHIPVSGTEQTRRHPAPNFNLGRLSVIMPAYNEADRIAASIAETRATLDGLGWDYELIIVDDGSTDGTFARAQQAAGLRGEPAGQASESTAGEHSSLFTLHSSLHSDFVRVVRLSRNCGKGMAVRYGLVYAAGDLIAFLDADLDLHPRLLAGLAEIMERTGADVVTGSKGHAQSRVLWPLIRRVTSAGYALAVKALFRLPVHDTQTGIKLFRREVLDDLFPRILIKRFAFDLELLVNAHHLGYTIAEAPVVLEFQRTAGRIHLRDIRNVLLDTLAVFYRLHILRYYDRLPNTRAHLAPAATATQPRVGSGLDASGLPGLATLSQAAEV